VGLSAKPAIATNEMKPLRVGTMQLARLPERIGCSLQIFLAPSAAFFFGGKRRKHQMLGFAQKFSGRKERHVTCEREFNAAARRWKQPAKGKDMSTLTARGNWNIAKGKLKQKLARLADDDLQFIEGKEDELTGRIQKRTGRAREKTEPTVDEGCGCKP
jgi:uncharacterized protein YjbJ (UPF0337 family)